MIDTVWADHGWKLAIAGGLLVLLFLVRTLRRSGTPRIETRRTQFHFVAIDPNVAEHRRAAWERRPSQPACFDAVDLEDEMNCEIDDSAGHTQIGYLVPPAPIPLTQLARGSQREIDSAETLALPIQAPIARRPMPARPNGWDAAMPPSVTARMRAVKSS